MTQLEALRLADMLENNYPLEPEAEEAAAGLRRLHEENEQLRQALAQPEQEPVAWGVFDGPNLHDVNFTEEDAQEMVRLKGDGSVVKPLYTAPPKREWVDLSREEMLELFEKYDGRPFSLMLATHDKAKEKNT